MALASAPMSGTKYLTPGCKPEWAFEDFFTMDPIHEHSVKIGIAKHLKIQYDTVNPEEPMAKSVNGVPAYDAAQTEALQQEYMDLVEAHPRQTGAERDDTAKTLKDKATAARVISGCLVKWRIPGKTQNIGYIKKWASTHLQDWDTSIERRAGGLNMSDKYNAQHLTLTNQSSLLAMIATFVEQFFKGTLTDAMIEAFQSIRVILFMSAEMDEIESSKRTLSRSNAKNTQSWTTSPSFSSGWML